VRSHQCPRFVMRKYEETVKRLNLIDEIGVNEQHPLYNLLDTLGTLVEAYEALAHLKQ
jgi:hypothetical protein